jgi:hypothetical protein
MENEYFRTVIRVIWDSDYQMISHGLCGRWIITEESQLTLFSYCLSSTQIMADHVVLRVACERNNSMQLVMLYATRIIT